MTIGLLIVNTWLKCHLKMKMHSSLTVCAAERATKRFWGTVCRNFQSEQFYSKSCVCLSMQWASLCWRTWPSCAAWSSLVRPSSRTAPASTWPPTCTSAESAAWSVTARSGRPTRTTTIPTWPADSFTSAGECLFFVCVCLLACVCLLVIVFACICLSVHHCAPVFTMFSILADRAALLIEMNWKWWFWPRLIIIALAIQFWVHSGQYVMICLGLVSGSGTPGQKSEGPPKFHPFQPFT